MRASGKGQRRTPQGGSARYVPLRAHHRFAALLAAGASFAGIGLIVTSAMLAFA